MLRHPPGGSPAPPGVPFFIVHRDTIQAGQILSRWRKPRARLLLPLRGTKGGTYALPSVTWSRLLWDEA
jgi:hypothetical protein